MSEESPREHIRKLVERILLKELEEYDRMRQEVDEQTRQRWADVIAKIASVPKKLELVDEEAEEDADLAQLLSSARSKVRGMISLRRDDFIHEALWADYHHRLAYAALLTIDRAHAIVVEIETKYASALPYDVLVDLGMVRRLLLEARSMLDV